jgi:hypothetical protein
MTKTVIAVAAAALLSIILGVPYLKDFPKDRVGLDSVDSTGRAANGERASASGLIGPANPKDLPNLGCLAGSCSSPRSARPSLIRPSSTGAIRQHNPT